MKQTKLNPSILILKTILRTALFLLPVLLIAFGFASALSAAEYQIAAPDGGLKVIVSDAGGLNYRVEVAGKTVLTNSSLGLEFKDGTRLGPAATIIKSATKQHNGQWENPFGNRRSVRDQWRELRLTLQERGAAQRTFGLIVRAYDRWRGISLRPAGKFRARTIHSDE